MTPRSTARLAALALLGTALGVAGLVAGAPDFATRPVGGLLVTLGEAPPAHAPTLADSAAIARGREIVTLGRTLSPAGDSTSQQSHFFRCVDCHLLEREDPSLAVSDPAARLKFGAAARQRFLPAVTLFGVVNKTSWYDGYERKYGDLAKVARHDLREAIQLCARECSMGRALEPWELESVLAFLWTLEYRVSDLGLSAGDMARLDAAAQTGASDPAAVARIRGAFLDRTPATFAAVADFVPGPGDAVAGHEVFQRTCLSCHGGRGPSHFDMTTAAARRDLAHGAREGSLLEAVRAGVPAPPWKDRPYMPEFTLERMSDAQLRDLFAYIETLAAGSDSADSDGAAAVGGAAPPPGDPVALAAAMQALVTTSCGGCHGKRAGADWVKFDYVDNLQKLATQKKFIAPGRPDESKLYRMVAGLQKPAMPHKRAPLTAAEVALVRAWISGLEPAGH